MSGYNSSITVGMAADNTRVFDPGNEAGLRALMDELGDSKTMFPGTNELGERIFISIAHDNIVVVTLQQNGWIRRNTYWRDGSREESFDGR